MLVYLAGYFAISNQMFSREPRPGSYIVEEGQQNVFHTLLWSFLKSMTSSLNPTMNVCDILHIINFAPTDGSHVSQGVWMQQELCELSQAMFRMSLLDVTGKQSMLINWFGMCLHFCGGKQETRGCRENRPAWEWPGRGQMLPSERSITLCRLA